MKWLLFSGVAVSSFTLLNLYFRRATFRTIDREIAALPWSGATEQEFLEKCYHHLSNRYEMLQRCYLKRPWTNFFYRNIWHAKSLPCHMYAIILNRCLRRKFSKEQLKIIFTSKIPHYPFVHFFSQVQVEGCWTNVDVWGKKRGIPLGKTIREAQPL